MRISDWSSDVCSSDLHSKQLSREVGLTTPQVVVLQAVRDLGEVTTGQLSRLVSLRQGTVTTILDGLESRGLVERYRSAPDRRIVHSRLTRDPKTVVQGKRLSRSVEPDGSGHIKNKKKT